MLNENYNLLVNGLELLKLPYNDDMLNKFKQYLILYGEWFDKINISSIQDEQSIVIRHFLDSLAPLSILKAFDFWNKGSKIIDLGSGAGFPGIPIKIIEPNKKISFAEVNKKKACFLKEVILNLRLRDSDVVDSSIGKVKESYQILLVRAFGSLDKIINEAKRYYSSKCKIIAYKGKESKIKTEISILPQKYKGRLKLIKVETPFLNEERHIVIIEI